MKKLFMLWTLHIDLDLVLSPLTDRQYEYTRDKSLFFFSNNMLYPKEDKENRILLYAVSIIMFCVIRY